MTTTVLDLLAAVCLVAFAYLVYPPAALLVAGLLIGAASWRLESARTRKDSA